MKVLVFIWSVYSVHADSFVINTDVLRSFLDPLCQKWQLCIFILTSVTCLYGNSEPNHSDFLTNCSDCNAMNAREKLCFDRFPNGNGKITSEIEPWNTCHILSTGDKIELIRILTMYRSFWKIKCYHKIEIYWQKHIQMFTKYIFLETISYKYHQISSSTYNIKICLFHIITRFKFSMYLIFSFISNNFCKFLWNRERRKAGCRRMTRKPRRENVEQRGGGCTQCLPIFHSLPRNMSCALFKMWTTHITWKWERAEQLNNDRDGSKRFLQLHRSCLDR